MHLATDYIHLYNSGARIPSRCRIRLYLPYEDADAAVVICSELANNHDTPLVNAAKQIAAEVIAHFKLPMPPVWIEHRLPEVTSSEGETFNLLTFAHYDTRRTLRKGTWRRELGPATRKPLDRHTVEVLVGQRV